MAAKNEDELTSEEIKKQIADAEKEIAEKQKLKRRLSRKISGVVEREQRLKDDRMKNHAGGMMRMVGLLDYKYQNPELYDNNQDDLIENLLVGGLMRLSADILKMSANELYEVYRQGKAYRDIKPSERKVSIISKELQGLFELLHQNKSNISDVKDCQNGDDGS